MFNPKFVLTAILAASVSVTATAEDVETERHKVSVSTLADGFTNPSGMTFLPDKSILVTERSGDIYWVSADGSYREKISGTPEVVAQGRGGMLDITTDPDFAENNWVYISYSEAAQDGGKGIVRPLCGRNLTIKNLLSRKLFSVRHLSTKAITTLVPG